MLILLPLGTASDCLDVSEVQPCHIFYNFMDFLPLRKSLPYLRHEYAIPLPANTGTTGSAFGNVEGQSTQSQALQSSRRRA